MSRALVSNRQIPETSAFPMNALESVYPFIVGWLLSSMYMGYAIVVLMKQREPGFRQTQHDVAVDVLHRLDLLVVLGGPILVGLVIELSWWAVALAMGVQGPF